MSLDGGLVAAILDEIVSLKETELTGFVSFGRDFVAATQATAIPRLVVNVGQNRKIFRTDATEIRAIGVSFQVWGNSEEVTNSQAEKLSSTLDQWAENPSSILLNEGAAVREMTIIGSTSTHEQPALWSVRFSTEWEIGIGRLNV